MKLVLKTIPEAGYWQAAGTIVFASFEKESLI
jgi:hypothetical protein